MELLKKSKKLNLSDFSNIDKALTKRILSSLKPKNLIGEGAVGKVYLIDKKFVVKEVVPCVADPNSKLYQYCSDILKIKDQIPSIPGGGGKTRYILPNLLSEILIGMIQGEMISFTRTLGSILSESKNQVKVYIVMEYNQPLVKDKEINLDMSTKDFLAFLFQISHGLYISQQKYKFTHYDLHIENILWKKWDKGEIRYSLPNFDLSLSVNTPVVYKISDFGLARLETDTTLITPAVDKFPQKTYGEFSPSYDIISFLGAICISNKYRIFFEPLFESDPDLHRFMFMFLLWVLNEKEIQLESDLSATRDKIGNKYYTSITTKENFFTFRPKTDGDFIKYSKAKSMVNIVNFLARILIAKKYGNLSNQPSMTPKLEKIDTFDKVVLFQPEVPKGKYIEVQIDDSISLRSYNILTKNTPKSYNFTLSDKQVEYCPFQENYITAVFVKNTKDYRFSFECCKLDVANYLVDHNRPGFVINGGFFDIKGDYLPIGSYKDKYFKTRKHKIPKEYQDVFGHVLLVNNKLSISRKVTDEKVLSTGPILIEGGEIVFNPDENRFTCNDSNHAENLVVKERANDITISGYYEYSSKDNVCQRQYVEDEQTYPRCDKIQPGELSHADNPNPRSALCILNDGTYVFLAVEGRGNRGIGMDLNTLSSVIKNSFPNVVSAINLDGGRSSTLAWRTSSNPKTIYISNPDRNYVYPVGNILTCLKK